MDLRTIRTILLLILLVILLGILFLLSLAKTISGKCPHWKYCELYDKKGSVCNETCGYFHYDHVSGCVADWDDKIRNRIAGKDWKKSKK